MIDNTIACDCIGCSSPASNLISMGAPESRRVYCESHRLYRPDVFPMNPSNDWVRSNAITYDQVFSVLRKTARPR